MKYNIPVTLLVVCACSISVNGFFLPFIEQWMDKISSSTGIGSSNPEDNQITGLKSILPHRVQSQLSPSSKEPAQGVEENGGIGIFGRNVLKGVQKGVETGVTKIMNIGSSFMNRIQANKSLDMEEDFMQQVPENKSFADHVSTIFPGTRWCGGGSSARSFDDLGRFEDTDKCCRDHDLCEDNILAGEEKHGLINGGLFTRSNCDCDKKFYNCLKDANSVISRQIGFTYFTVLGPQCFTYDYPIVGCLRRNIKKCVEYKRDETQEKTWHWVDNDLFLK